MTKAYYSQHIKTIRQGQNQREEKTNLVTQGMPMDVRGQHGMLLILRKLLSARKP